MATYDDFVSYIQPDVEGCPAIAITNAVRDALAEFCERTRIWIGASIQIDLVEDQREYPITAPADTYILGYNKVRTKEGYVIDETSEDELDNMHRGWRTYKGKPSCYFATYEGITLAEKADGTHSGPLYAFPILKPSRASQECPQWLFEEWVEAISFGAKYRLHLMLNKPWTDLNKAQYCNEMFKSGISKAISKKMKSRTQASRTIQAVRFGG